MFSMTKSVFTRTRPVFLERRVWFLSFVCMHTQKREAFPLWLHGEIKCVSQLNLFVSTTYKSMLFGSPLLSYLFLWLSKKSRAVEKGKKKASEETNCRRLAHKLIQSASYEKGRWTVSVYFVPDRVSFHDPPLKDISLWLVLWSSKCKYFKVAE